MSPEPSPAPRRIAGARHGRLRPWLLILALLLLALSALALSAAPQATSLYLPVILHDHTSSAAKGIGGTVTDQNKPAPAVELALRRYDDNDETTVAAATTNGQGAYLFSGVPTLPAGNTYYVRYGPNDDVTTRLWYWYGADIDSYVAGTAVSGSDFDISDIVLRKPDPGATVAPPVTFQWQRRQVAGDDYQIELFDPDSGDSWFTNTLGDVGQFVSTNLPDEIVPGKVYGWTMWVYHGDDAFGIAYWYNDIIFSSTVQATAAGPQTWLRENRRALVPDGRPQRR